MDKREFLERFNQRQRAAAARAQRWGLSLEEWQRLEGMCAEQSEVTFVDAARRRVRVPADLPLWATVKDEVPGSIKALLDVKARLSDLSENETFWSLLRLTAPDCTEEEEMASIWAALDAWLGRLVPIRDDVQGLRRSPTPQGPPRAVEYLREFKDAFGERRRYTGPKIKQILIDVGVPPAQAATAPDAWDGKLLPPSYYEMPKPT